MISPHGSGVRCLTIGAFELMVDTRASWYSAGGVLV
jgi:hypothetical protein